MSRSSPTPALTCGLVGAFGYFTRLVLLELGVDIPWYVYSAVAVVIIGSLGYRSADLSAKVLGTLMIAEFAVLVVFDLLVVGEHGSNAFPAVSFTGAQVFSGSIGIALMFAFTSFVGFESAALYGEETKNPERSIPRATYIAVVTIGIFYILTTWIIIGAAGGTQAPELAGEQLGNFVFNLILDAGGTVLYDLAAVLFCTSVLASALALHNAASRYLFALGREHVVPAALGKYHPRHHSPYVASLWVTGLAAVSTLAMALFGADPYTVFATSFIGLGTLGIIALQAAAALAVVVFFWRRPDRNLWRCIIAPLIGFIGLATGFALAVTHYSTLTGSTNVLVDTVPALLIVGGGRRRGRRAPAAPQGNRGLRRDRGLPAPTAAATRQRSAAPVDYTAPLLRRRRRSGRSVHGPGPARGRRPVRLVRAAQRRRRHLGHGQSRQPDVRQRALHQLEVHQRILRLSDAGRLSRLPELAADPRLHQGFRSALRPVRPGDAVRRGDPGATAAG